MCQYNEIPFDFEVYGKCCGGEHLTRKQENKVHAMMKKNAYKSNFKEDQQSICSPYHIKHVPTM